MNRIKISYLLPVLALVVFVTSFVNTSSTFAITDPNGAKIIEEQDIRMTPQDYKKQQDEATMKNVLITILALGLIGSLLWILYKIKNVSSKKK